MDIFHVKRVVIVPSVHPFGTARHLEPVLHHCAVIYPLVVPASDNIGDPSGYGGCHLLKEAIPSLAIVSPYVVSEVSYMQNKIVVLFLHSRERIYGLLTRLTSVQVGHNNDLC